LSQRPIIYTYILLKLLFYTSRPKEGHKTSSKRASALESKKNSTFKRLIDVWISDTDVVLLKSDYGGDMTFLYIRGNL